MFSALTLGLQMGLTTAVPMPAAIVALETRPQFALDLYTRQIERNGGWWVEVEDRLLVAAPATRLPDLLEGQRVIADLGWIRPDDFAIQTRACGVEEGPQLPAVVDVGRFAIVRTPATLLPYKAPDVSEWRPLVPNQVLVRDLRARGYMAAARGGVDAQVQQRVDAMDPERWFDSVEVLASYDRSSYGGEIDQARDWLAAQFQGLGLSVTTPSFTFGSYTVENVVGQLTGSRYPNELIIVGGHYDSRQSQPGNPNNTPGAEDNASGCSGVLEAARVFTQFPPQRTMIFVCFAGEEQGLFGGHAYAQSLVDAGRQADVKLALIMDMIGYSGDTDLDAMLESSTAFPGLFDPFVAAAATYAPELRLVQDFSPCCSDHAPFISRNMPSLLTIEYDYSPSMANGYQHYHQTTDLPQNMTRALQMGGGILKMNIAVLTQAAGFEPPVFFDGFE
jgi:hypothetical protein